MRRRAVIAGLGVTAAWPFAARAWPLSLHAEQTGRVARIGYLTAVFEHQPAIMRISVVLPQPEGPRIEKNSPGATAKLTSSTASCASKRFVTAVRSRSGVGDIEAEPREGRTVARERIETTSPAQPV